MQNHKSMYLKEPEVEQQVCVKKQLLWDVDVKWFSVYIQLMQILLACTEMSV